MEKISVVVNTLNEEENLPRALSSLKGLADEIVIVDMKSTDATLDIAQKAGAKVYEHERVGYVEPARNFAISKATNGWILILDADEEIPESLAEKLKEIAAKPKADYFRLPRKNINFGRWIRNSRWWPDYNIRFFRKGTVTWNEVIHSVPMTTGQGADIPAEEKYAIIHHNYSSIGKYIERMNRYTDIQARMLSQSGYKFIWKDLIRKPVSEFLSRYFAGEGYKDGLHGFTLACLQGISEYILYLKVWQSEKFITQGFSIGELSSEINSAKSQFNWWKLDHVIKTKNFLVSLPLRIYRRILSENG